MLYNFIGFNMIPWEVQLIWHDTIGFNWKWSIFRQHLHCEPISESSRRGVQVTGLFNRKILMYVHKWNLLPIVSCMALGYISTQAILNTNPVVAAVIWICRWWQYQRDPLPIVGCTALDTFQTKQCETQSPLWRLLNRSFGGYNITEPRRWGSIIYNLASRHTFSVQLPSVRGTKKLWYIIAYHF